MLANFDVKRMKQKPENPRALGSTNATASPKNRHDPQSRIIVTKLICQLSGPDV